MSAPARLRVRLWYDYASSLCYVAHRALARLEPDLDALGIELDWSPLDLARLLGWRRGAAIEGVRRANVARVAEELGVPLRIPTHWADSRPALAASVVLAGGPREATFRERVWTALYEEGRSLDRLESLAEIAAELDLELPDLDEALLEVEARTRAASEASVTGAPTFMLGDWPFGGIQDDETMRLVLGRFASRERARRAGLA